VLSLLIALGASAPVRAGPSAESAADHAIEAQLPLIESRLRLRQSRETMAFYSTRVDWAGRLLWGWANSDDQGALETFQALVTQDAGLPWAYAGIARVYLHWKIWDQADAALTRACKLNASVAEFWVLRGDLERLRGQPARAGEAYLKALQLRPTPFADDGLGLLAASAKHPDEARSRFLAARALRADDYLATRGLADLALAAGDSRGALTELVRLQQLAPENLGLRLESIDLRKKVGDSTGIVADAEVAFRLGAHDPSVLKVLLAHYQQTGRTAEERSVLKELGTSGDLDAQGYRRLGELDLAAGKEVEALEDYQKAIVLSPKDAGLLRAHATLLLRRGMLVEAIEDCRQLQALNEDPGDDLKAVLKTVALARKPISGSSVAAINLKLGSELNKLYRTLLRDKPSLAGTMRLQVWVKADGRATGSEYKENTVASPELAANLYWNARDARYPRAAARYTFSFELRQPARTARTSLERGSSAGRHVAESQPNPVKVTDREGRTGPGQVAQN
jgi:tetratricopeptide (TPR) repeat protein